MHRLTVGILAETGSDVFTWVRTRSILESAGVRIVWFRETPNNSPLRRLKEIPARLVWRMQNYIEHRDAVPFFE